MKLLRFLPMITVMGIIFFLSSQSGDSLDLPDITNLDKLLHAVAYGVLALTTLYAVPEDTYRAKPYRISLLVVLLCLLYGSSDELHQSFVPARTPSLFDLLADILGGVAAVVVWFKMKKKTVRRVGTD